MSSQRRRRASSRSLVVETSTRNDRFFEATKFRPGNRLVAYHPVILMDEALSKRCPESGQTRPMWACGYSCPVDFPFQSERDCTGIERNVQIP